MSIIPDMLNNFYNYYYRINFALVFPSYLKYLRLLVRSTVQLWLLQLDIVRKKKQFLFYTWKIEY